MKISCCIIGKNEIDDIGNCLKSVYDKVYEIIYVDTGSEDGTLEYVKENFPKVKTFFYKWNDDFSAARNFSIRRAKGDFLFYLDCDEEFVGEFPKSLAKGVYNFEIRNINDTGGYVASVCSRLIANEKGVCFKGKIHEIFNSPSVKLPVFKFNEGYVLHHGYKNSYRDKKNKSERNIEALKKSYEESQTTQNTFYLAQEYFILKDYKTAYDLAMSGIDLIKEDSPIDQTFKPLLYHLFVSCAVEMGLDDVVENFDNNGVVEIADNPECNIVLLQYYMKKDNEGKVLKHAFQALKNINRAILPVKFIEKNVRYVPYLALAKYYGDKNDNLMALYFLELAYGSGFDDLKVLVDIYNLLPKCEKNLDKWELYNSLLYEKTKDEKLIKDMIGCYIASKDEDKNLKAIDIVNKMCGEEEKQKIKNHLEKIGKKKLIQYLK